MNEKEWDEFAEEYYEIQQESQVTIAEDVKNYLKTEKVLPAETAADVAGGSGRFLSLAKEINRYDLIDFSSGMLENAKKEAEKNELPNVSFIKQSLEEFIQSNETYEMVFTAANPALVHLIQLEKLMKKSSKWCVIIRVVESIDDVFYPIEKQLGMIEEDPNTSPVVMDQFETYLIDEGFKVKKKDFTYFTQESITEELMKLYYDAYAKDPVVTRYIRKLFSEKREILSTTKLTYRLLLWSADKKRTFHDSRRVLFMILLYFVVTNIIFDLCNRKRYI